MPFGFVAKCLLNPLIGGFGGESMARRRNSSAAEDLMDLVALLPRWPGVGLALASYWVLQVVATRPSPAMQSAQQIGQSATTAMAMLVMGLFELRGRPLQLVVAS